MMVSEGPKRVHLQASGRKAISEFSVRIICVLTNNRTAPIMVIIISHFTGDSIASIGMILTRDTPGVGGLRRPRPLVESGGPAGG